MEGVTIRFGGLDLGALKYEAPKPAPRTESVTLRYEASCETELAVEAYREFFRELLPPPPIPVWQAFHRTYRTGVRFEWVDATGRALPLTLTCANGRVSATQVRPVVATLTRATWHGSSSAWAVEVPGHRPALYRHRGDAKRAVLLALSRSRLVYAGVKETR